MKNMTHGNDIHVWKRILKKTSRLKTETAVELALLHVFLKDWPHFWKVETEALQVGVRQRYLHCQVALGGSHVGEGTIMPPRPFLRDNLVRTAANAGHCGEKRLQASGAGVERLEIWTSCSTFAFVLLFAG